MLFLKSKSNLSEIWSDICLVASLLAYFLPKVQNKISITYCSKLACCSSMSIKTNLLQMFRSYNQDTGKPIT